ncbi:MAG: PIN domain-containing protein [Hormoscilla sp. GM7CHS1pb]|nr:PIN domain-containing protein [Hormoscilla sp. GM7CHS1pb]
MAQLNIPASSRVYVDTAMVIYSVEKFPEYFPMLQPMWLQMHNGEIEIFSSELTLMEAIVVPIRNSDTLLVNAYEQLLLSTEMQLIPISQSLLREAASLRASTANLRTPDAIHVATSFVANCTLFLTNDKRLRNVPNLPITILSEVLESE